MKKFLPIILILILVGSFCFFYLYRKDRKPTIIETVDISKQKIDSLNGIITNLEKEKDSIKNKIDSSEEKVKIITRIYEKELIDLANNDLSADCRYFSKYLSENFK